MNREALVAQIKEKQSFLCVGLDTDIKKLPTHLPADAAGVLEFNKAIIEATAPFTVAYKINTAFYESMGAEGWTVMQETLSHIPKSCFTIADAKRGDIGNTSAMYARAFFENMSFDSVTVAPYMGEDSVTPFLGFNGKWVILLGLTSNAGSNDFQLLTNDGRPFFQHVAEKAQTWASPNELMFVVGATRGEGIGNFRKVASDSFLLVPGVGKQGGSLKDVVDHAMIDDCGLLVNSSRGIIYASSGEDFAQEAANQASILQKEMQEYLKMRKLV